MKEKSLNENYEYLKGEYTAYDCALVKLDKSVNLTDFPIDAVQLVDKKQIGNSVIHFNYLL